LCPWPWLGDDYDVSDFTWDMAWSAVKQNLRGFSIVLEEVAKCSRPISEFVVDVEGQPTGIGHQFLLGPSVEYAHFKTICGRGLRRLDLALNVGSHKICGLPTLNQGNLALALSLATQLEYFSLHTSARTGLGETPFLDIDDFDDDCCLSVNSLPVTEWKSLRCLSLSHLPVMLEDLVSLLGLLPPSTQIVKLIQIEIVDSTWEKALQRLKDDLRWSRKHPRIALAQEIYDCPNRKIWIEEEILRFLEGGHNPFIGGRVQTPSIGDSAPSRTITTAE
jgi:hypothetical protein